MVSALAVASLIAGCAIERHYYHEPVCEPEIRPVLPSIDAGELWDAVGPVMFADLEDLQAALVSWALANEAIINSVCRRPGE